MKRIRQLVLFDGSCGLCSRFVRWGVRTVPLPDVVFAASQSEAGQAWLQRIQESPDPSTVLVVQSNGVWKKSAAVFAFLKLAKPPWRYLYALRWIPRPIRDFLYDRIARNRHLFFKSGNSCQLDPEVQKRIVESIDPSEIRWNTDP